MTRVIFLAPVLLISLACSSESAENATAGAMDGGADGQTPPADAHGSLELEQLSDWVRHPESPIFSGNLIASDPHVWEETPGKYRMVYTDGANDADRQAIAMATSTDLVHWAPIAGAQYPNGVVLQAEGPGGQDGHQETAFYRKANDGMHQIFYIGYPDESSYHSAIYKAEATDIEGPYEREQDPVISWTADGNDAQSMTSPTIVEHDGTLYMTYVGWKTFPDGPVINMGATSTNDGRTWVKVGPLPLDDVFGVEAHNEKGPDGLFYRVGITGDDQGGDVITLGRSAHPFGPYTVLPKPILEPLGPSVGEGDTIMCPSLLFRQDVGTAYLHYAAVDTGGWPWATSLATCEYGG